MPPVAAGHEPIHLLPIGRDGGVAGAGALPTAAQEACAATAAFYRRAGFSPPWIGYAAFLGSRCVGACAFKNVPRRGACSVEIGYFTFPENEGRGIATRMAAALVEMARAAAAPERVVVTAHTLPREGPSTSVLRKLGFVRRGEVVHPEDGPVWDWELPPP
jgi:RimJ/RimL family protein N-acetyltransferase